MERPQNILFFDVETLQEKIKKDEWRLNFRLASALFYYVDKGYVKKFYITRIGDFWKIVERLTREKTTLYVVAHNISFDFLAVKGISSLKDMGWKNEVFIMNGTTNVWIYRKNTRKIIFLDNMNFFNTSIEKLGESIGFKKMRMPPFSASDKRWFLYCENDVKIMFEAWKLYLSFIKQNELGTFAKTLAGQAFNAFRHRFMRHNIFIHNSNKAIEMERAAYKGGRTEAFFIGKPPADNYYILDINSMYPAVMKNNLYPYKLEKVGKSISLSDAQLLLTNGKRMVAECAIKTSEPVFAARADKKLIFPVGTFKEYLTSPEILYGIKNRTITYIGNYCLYAGDYIFSDFVDFFWKKRLEFRKNGNLAFDYLSKILLNSLYGKFGQRNEIWKETNVKLDLPDGYYTILEDDNKKDFEIRIWGGKIEKLIGKIEGYESFPAISAHVTAYGRLMLWKIIKKAGRKNVFYCDTDSVIVNQAGFNNLRYNVSPRLGMLKVEDKTRAIEIRGLKDYTFGNREKIKGIKENATPLNKYMFRQKQFFTLKTAMRTGSETIRMVNMVKVLNRKYDKGAVLPSGRVKPLTMDNTLR